MLAMRHLVTELWRRKSQSARPYTERAVSCELREEREKNTSRLRCCFFPAIVVPKYEGKCFRFEGMALEKVGTGSILLVNATGQCNPKSREKHSIRLNGKRPEALSDCPISRFKLSCDH
jgi:hypothetical protein